MLVVDESRENSAERAANGLRSRPGPGGQNVNKVNTKAVLRWPVATAASIPEDVRSRFLKRFHRRISGEGDLVISSPRFRDRGRDVADCIAKLRDMLAEVAQPPTPRKATRPTRGSKVRRRRRKDAQSQKNDCGDDHPAMSKNLTDS